MFEPLFKLILTKLDFAIDWYLERQKLAILFVIPGTLLFLMLFVMFTGAGGAMVFLGMMMTITEAVLAIGLFLLQQHYQEYIRQRVEIADAIEAKLTNADYFGEWSTFLETPQDRSNLEEIRVACLQLPEKCPPQGDEYCGAEGLAVLESLVPELRVGIATKFGEDAARWWRERRAARKERKARGDMDPDQYAVSLKHQRVTQERQQMAAATVKHVPSLSGGSMISETERSQIEKEAAKEAKKAAKELSKESRKAERQTAKAQKTAKKATRAAIKQERLMEQPLQSEPRPLSEPELGPGPSLSLSSPSAQAVVMEDEIAPTVSLDHVERPAVYKPPPKTKGLSEAAALQQILKAGFTAHHYDKIQQALTRQLGCQPTPAQVVKALMNERKRSKKARKTSKRAKTPRGSRVVAAQRSMHLHGIGLEPHPSNTDHQGPQRKGGLRVLVVFAAIVGSPFVYWRVPDPQNEPKVIIGSVRHQVLDEAPDMTHSVRTQFESLLGNKSVTLVAGPRLYVSEADYIRCWPESWEQIYTKRYTLRVTAEAQPLLCGGYGVARITSVERVDKPMANAD